MSRAGFNNRIFLLEGLNALATSFYFNYLFFFFKTQYGFSNLDNLLVCALNGFVYVPCAFFGGRLGQRRGYLQTFALGSVIMLAALSFSAAAKSVPMLLLGMCCWTIGVCCTWPNLEALVCDKETPARLPGVIGVYNVVWSAGGAIAYFAGGAIAESAGWRSIFWIPAVSHALLALFALSLRRSWSQIVAAFKPSHADGCHESHPEGPVFLKMAWVANPFAYVAINATIPLIPDLATRFALSAKFAGFFCSIWFFARMITFGVLAAWPGWHYRFRYLIFAYAGMVACFCAMLLVNHLLLVILVQLAFGWCLGLIYYSSLYYSMHVGETKGEHGGVHEAAIGLGIFGGPAIGAGSLFLFPGWKQSSVLGVAMVLGIGFLTLLNLNRRRQARGKSAR